ncbi:helix-turn-helix domain-containing protein [Thalassovita aquimarina]|uniref:Helix-turn-helix domain-containing protein n=1 Tax=Thalassovita aquimarina TaxID=2785917 RepID=A0ABS5HQV9_9RHOB|nr:helix-turn-helix domain-containing protein [Thalassovita aquimarina]MBR9651362.1 helix-turn-helix domain-containing protein [Thalassovita aquimarina]
MFFSTDHCEDIDKNKVWSETLSSTYFPLSAECRNPVDFKGNLKSWALGVVGLSEMECDSVMYRRNKSHFKEEKDNSLLITIPHRVDVHFQQSSRQTSCGPGSFLVERGDMPYEFSHAQRNKLWVLKVPTSSVQSRLGPTDRLGALTFDATSGIGSYFVGAVRNALESIDAIDSAAREMAGQHLLDLLCLSMRSDDRILDSASSSIRAAHLQRAEQFIRDNLANPNLNSQMVAESCGISLRYLQGLFAENDYSVVGYIREQRLARCHETLRMVHESSTLAQIAHRWGFYDQAQFCKYYRVKYGCTPSDTRKNTRVEAAVTSGKH